MAKTYIGTSGWQYSHWKGSFYPPSLPLKDWLSFYSQKFVTVEVNSSFYRQVRLSTIKKWQSEVPKSFIFSLKGNRFITHIKRLKNCEEALKIFFENTSTLCNHHLILWQLPPSLKINIKRLNEFLALLPKNFRQAFEFRHLTWVSQETWDCLKKYKAAAVFQDWREWPQIREVTADFIYLRFHGNKSLYSSNYKDDELKEWGNKIKKWRKIGFDVYAYFNNDALGFATANALKLKEIVFNT